MLSVPFVAVAVIIGVARAVVVCVGVLVFAASVIVSLTMTLLMEIVLMMRLLRSLACVLCLLLSSVLLWCLCVLCDRAAVVVVHCCGCGRGGCAVAVVAGGCVAGCDGRVACCVISGARVAIVFIVVGGGAMLGWGVVLRARVCCAVVFARVRACCGA